MPTTPITAPEVAPLEADDAVFHKINLLALRNTVLGNILDLCAVALPNGRDASDMPTSILISAGMATMTALLGYALEMERVIRESSATDRRIEKEEDGMSGRETTIREIRTRPEDAPRRARRRLCRPLAGAGRRLQLVDAATHHRMVLGRDLEPARASTAVRARSSISA